MADNNQLSFGDGLLSGRRKLSKLSKHLDKLVQIIDWKPLVQQIHVIDKTNKKIGGRYYSGYKGHVGGGYWQQADPQGLLHSGIASR